MAAAAKKPAAVESSVVVAATSFAGAHGVFTQGARVRADHPQVLASPSLFMPDGSVAEDLAARVGEIWHRPAEELSNVEEERKRRERQARNYVRCTKSFVVNCEEVDGLPTWGSISVSAGELVEATNPIVRQYAMNFQPLEP